MVAVGVAVLAITVTVWAVADSTILVGLTVALGPSLSLFVDSGDLGPRRGIDRLAAPRRRSPS